MTTELALRNPVMLATRQAAVAFTALLAITAFAAAEDAAPIR
jgi:hypothetical protein